MPDNTYNGWANYVTWNVAPYVQNEYDLYLQARRCDNDPELDLEELNEMIRELNEMIQEL